MQNKLTTDQIRKLVIPLINSKQVKDIGCSISQPIGSNPELVSYINIHLKVSDLKLNTVLKSFYDAYFEATWTQEKTKKQVSPKKVTKKRSATKRVK